MTANTIKIADIDISGRLKPEEEALVEAYAGIAEARVAAGQSPLIQPIVVRSKAGGGYQLTDGLNRLKALERIGFDPLTFGREFIVNEEDDDAARDTEIFANLSHGDMTALDRSIFLATAKERYDAKRGETRGRKRKDQQFKEDKKGTDSGLISSERFTKHAAARLNLAHTQVKEACAIARALLPDQDDPPSTVATKKQTLDDLRGAAIADNAQELKALVEIDVVNRRKAVAAIRGGAAKTVRDARVVIGLDKKVEDDPQLHLYKTITDIWVSKLDSRHKAKFMVDQGLVAARKESA